MLRWPDVLHGRTGEGLAMRVIIKGIAWTRTFSQIKEVCWIGRRPGHSERKSQV